MNKPIIFPDSFLERKHPLGEGNQWVYPSFDNIKFSIVGGTDSFYGNGKTTFEFLDMDNQVLKGWQSIDQINQYLDANYNQSKEIEVSIELTRDKALEIFYDAICNSLTIMLDYGLYLDFDDITYNNCKSYLQEKNPNDFICYEDVIKQILLDGYYIFMIDTEGDYSQAINLDEICANMKLVPINYISDMINGNDDATTGDVILQYCFFKDLIFG